ncbi:MAG: ferredoxin [Bdellovibrionales bacterium]|jgi:ferredoxin|nr:ferredoxin [Bdellovibrionales bacterium]MBT3526567.1 ferredoxin [Bdellovibrionales bacterium]MBT7669770.1 ferredoxin [Bdellovibrionales bacterium]MBT7766277.1 ferredoxin [Bdellovibrionales bacterium]
MKKFQIDDQCIACNACVQEAEEHFKMNDDQGVAFIIRQPETVTEIERCQLAMAACPVESITFNS